MTLVSSQYQFFHMVLHHIGKVMKLKKLTHQFISPYQNIKRIGLVAYQISLPPIHSVFHVFQLRKYIFYHSYVIMLDIVQLKNNLTFETMPIQITDKIIKHLRGI